jgi:site-specific recombinase
MSFNEILENLKSDENAPVSYLIALVNETGIHSNRKPHHIENKIKELTLLLNNRPDLAQSFRNYLIELYSNYDSFTLYTDAGILPGHGFFAEAYKRLKYKILPPLQDPTNGQFLIRQVFYKKDDNQKIDNVDESIWLNLLEAINIDFDVVKWKQQNLNYLLNALMVLSQRITAIGLEPEVVDKLPEIDDLQSPFFGLYREVEHFVDSFKENVKYVENNDVDYQQILVMCSQCKESISELHKHKEKYGISIHLAFLMLRLEQHVKRLNTILQLVQSKDKEVFNNTLFEFMREVVYAENKKYSVGKHLNDNLSLIAYKITEHTSRVGEHYRAETRSEYFTMFKAAMGGGFIVALVVLFKVFAHHLHLPPFGEAFMFSMVYALGFIAIHFFHFTLATKQPAMTANTIAASLDQTEKSDKYMLKTVKLIAEISRAQFISLVGNIIIVLPAAYLLGMAYLYLTGNNVITTTEAKNMISSMHPWHTASLFYAAIAGLFLMSSGMIAGFYDNKVIYGRIPERIKQHPFLKKIFTPGQLQMLSKYLKNNTGLLLGNFFLGVFLGTAPLLGKFFGLPIDVRHVTLSTGNFGLALQSSDRHIPSDLIIEVSISIILMGIINLFVSFGLSIYVAVRSRSLNVSLMRSILRAIHLYFRARPTDFFVPPPKDVFVEDKTIEKV